MKYINLVISSITFCILSYAAYLNYKNKNKLKELEFNQDRMVIRENKIAKKECIIYLQKIEDVYLKKAISLGLPKGEKYRDTGMMYDVVVEVLIDSFAKDIRK